MTDSREWIRECLAEHYGQEVIDPLALLPVPNSGEIQAGELPPVFTAVRLPDWAQTWSVEGSILVPSHMVAESGPDWEQIDWWAVMVWYADGLAEREFESVHGSIHSYSSRLRGWDKQMWEYAWVNRIACFLMQWAVRVETLNEKALDSLPKGNWMLTHDIDAITKKWTLRLKQSVFFSLNAFRLALRGKFTAAKGACGSVWKFLFGKESYQTLGDIKDLESRNGLKSHFYVYAMPANLRSEQSFATRVIDPQYDIAEEGEILDVLRELVEEGWTIGLHPSHASWEDEGMIVAQKKHLEKCLGRSVSDCRQHWLKFSWENTWRAQAGAGMTTDATLGFNDRSGFRNGCAFSTKRNFFGAGKLVSHPMVLMDSHLYAYRECSGQERRKEIERLTDELLLVGGQGTAIWHNHVLEEDFGWRAGYEELVAAAAANG